MRGISWLAAKLLKKDSAPWSNYYYYYCAYYHCYHRPYRHCYVRYAHVTEASSSIKLPIVLTSEDTSNRSRSAVLPGVSHCLFVSFISTYQEYSRTIQKFHFSVISLRVVALIFLVLSIQITANYIFSPPSQNREVFCIALQTNCLTWDIAFKKYVECSYNMPSSKLSLYKLWLEFS